jgi:predicted nucleic acid-binding protein
MNLVLDSNIVFSTLLNPNSVIGELLMNADDDFTFYAPKLLYYEIENYSNKIELYTKLNKYDLIELKESLFGSINFIKEDIVSKQNRILAYELTYEIDEFDIPFVALALELDTKLWSGDKKLKNGLLLKGKNIIITTEDLKNLHSKT